MEKGLLIVYSGPSGVGKGTVRAVFDKNPKLNLAFSVSMTTRKQREGEVDGVDYFFVTNEEFDKAIAEGKLLEWAEFAGNKYGTPVDYVNNLRNEGKNVLLEIEVLGAKQVIDKADDALSIFLVPPSLEHLEARLRGRATEDEAKIKMRLARAVDEIASKSIYNYVVENHDVNKASDEITTIILDESDK